MILELLIRLFFGLINLIIAMLPQIKMPDGLSGMLADATFLFSFATYFLPVGTILSCLGFIFLVDNVKFLMSVFNWIISKIPGIS